LVSLLGTARASGRRRTALGFIFGHTPRGPVGLRFLHGGSAVLLPQSGLAEEHTAQPGVFGIRFAFKFIACQSPLLQDFVACSKRVRSFALFSLLVAKESEFDGPQRVANEPGMVPGSWCCDDPTWVFCCAVQLLALSVCWEWRTFHRQQAGNFLPTFAVMMINAKSGRF
jgi:hypothetical protein